MICILRYIKGTSGLKGGGRGGGGGGGGGGVGVI